MQIPETEIIVTKDGVEILRLVNTEDASLVDVTFPSATSVSNSMKSTKSQTSVGKISSRFFRPKTRTVMHRTFAAILTTVSALAMAPCAGAAEFASVLAGEPHEGFGKAAFNLWVPEGTGPLRGVIVYKSPNLRDLATAAWHELGTRQRFGIMTFAPVQDGESAKKAAAEIKRQPFLKFGDRGETMFKAIKELGAKSGHPELDQAPVIPGAIQDSSPFVLQCLYWQPARTLAFFMLFPQWGKEAPAMAKPEPRKVPGLFAFVATDEAKELVRGKALVESERKRGAAWCALVESDRPQIKGEIANHHMAHSQELLIPFLEECIVARLGAPGAASTPPKLVALPETKGWVGELEGGEIAPASTYTKPLDKTSWLPSEATAKIWQQLQK